MDWRFKLFSAIYIVINIFCMYYLMAFTIIYEKSAPSWIQGAFLSLFLDWVVLESFNNLATAALRSCAQKYPIIR